MNSKIMDMLVVANQAHADWVLDFAEGSGPSENRTEALIAARIALHAEVTRLERAVALVSRFQSCPDKFAICDELKELLS